MAQERVARVLDRGGGRDRCEHGYVVENGNFRHALRDDTLGPQQMPNRRPQLEIIAPSASPEEAAAVVAAVEQFLRATAAPPAADAPARNPWQRAALLEGTGRQPDEPSPWGDPNPW